MCGSINVALQAVNAIFADDPPDAKGYNAYTTHVCMYVLVSVCMYMYVPVYHANM